MSQKTILVTGATDGIGRRTAEKLLEMGHRVLLHGRDAARVDLVAQGQAGVAGRYVADFSNTDAVRNMAAQIREAHSRIDVVINNAGVLKVAPTDTPEGMDVRFAVNTVAPYILTCALLPGMPRSGRVITLASAAQAPVDPALGFGSGPRDDMAAYAQSKLAAIVWMRDLARRQEDGPSFIAVNPGSLLATKMVRDGFGYRGRPIDIGADVLCDATLGADFDNRSGAYFDNDKKRFADPHDAALQPDQQSLVMAALAQWV